jgi:DNA-binding NtrC family response regulator
MSAQTPSSNRTNQQADFERPSLLIVDDDYDTCDLMCAFLSRDYNCDTAFDGQQALDKIRSKRFACILADLMLPKLDGYEVMMCAASVAPATPIIVVTAVAGESARAIKMGAFDYIVKPFDLEQVERSVRRAIEGNTLLLSTRQ